MAEDNKKRKRKDIAFEKKVDADIAESQKTMSGLLSEKDLKKTEKQTKRRDKKAGVEPPEQPKQRVVKKTSYSEGVDPQEFKQASTSPEILDAPSPADQEPSPHTDVDLTDGDNVSASVVKKYDYQTSGVRPDGEGGVETPSEIAKRSVRMSKLTEAITKPEEKEKSPEERQAELNQLEQNAEQLDQEIIKTEEQRKASKVAEAAMAGESKVQVPLTKDDVEKAKVEIEDALLSGDEEAVKTAEKMNRILQRSQRPSEPAIERLNLQDYYPDIAQPIRVGSYQGSIVGSIPIFAAGGGYFPAGVLDARRRAIEEAAKKKAKQQEAFMKMLFLQSPEQIQEDVNQIAMDLFEKHGSSVNYDVSKLSDMSTPEGRKFFEDYLGYKRFVDQANGLQKVVNQTLKDANAEGKYIPDEMYNEGMKWLTGVTEKGIEYYHENPKEFAKIRDKFKVYQSMSHFVDGKVDQLKEDIMPMVAESIDEALAAGGKRGQIARQAMTTIMSTNDYNVIAQEIRKFVSDERLDIISKGIKDSAHLKQTPEEISEYIRGLMGSGTIEVKTMIARKMNVAGRIAAARAGRPETPTEKPLFSSIRDGAWNPATNSMQDGVASKFKQIVSQFKSGALNEDGAKTAMLKAMRDAHMSQDIVITPTGNKNLLRGSIDISSLPISQKSWNKTVGSSNVRYIQDGVAYSAEWYAKNGKNERLRGIINSNPNELMEATPMSAQVEWRYVDPNSGKSKELKTEDLLKTPDLINYAKPHMRVAYKFLNPDYDAEGSESANDLVWKDAPAIVQVYDLTDEATKAGWDAEVSAANTQSRYTQKAERRGTGEDKPIDSPVAQSTIVFE